MNPYDLLSNIRSEKAEVTPLMLGLRKFKSGIARVKELAQDLFFTCFPITLHDKDAHKFLNLKEIGTIEIKDMAQVKAFVYSHFCSRKNVVFYFNEEEKAEILNVLNSYYPDNKNATLTEADFIVNHKLKIFGPTRYDLGKAIDWSLDVLSGKRWPLSYFKNIRMSRQDMKGDGLYTAKLNWHQHLTTLARAYLYSKNSKYYGEIINQITDWIQKNPYKMGINWKSPLGVSLRALSWIWSLTLLGFHNIDPDRFWKILKSLYLHGKFIEENLSLDQEYPNNHLIGEAATLTILGIFFPEFREAEHWKRMGLEILNKELSRQYFDSGVHKEQALGYHLFVTEFYAQVYLLCRRNNIDSQFIVKKLEQMYEYLMMIYQPGGMVPMWGDSSDMRAVNLSDQENEILNAFFSTGSVLFDRTDMKKLCSRFSEEALWLLTDKGYYQFQNMKETEIRYNSYAYRDAGIFIMRDGWQQASRYLAIDCGPQGLGKAGHGHADMLSFELWANGKSLIIDPGTFRYNNVREWRQYFRGTSAHNTIVVDGLDQSDAYPGPFGWRKLAHPKLCSWYISEDFDYFEGEHDGYERLVQPVKHHRKILFIKGEYWIISDVLTGEGKHTFNCLFHFSPGKVRLNREDKSLITCHTQSNIKIIPLNNGIEAKVIEGSEDPIQGWVSYGYGSKVKAPVLQYNNYCETPAHFDIVLYPYMGEEEPSITIEEVRVFNKQGNVVNQKDARCLKIRINEVEDFCLFSTADPFFKCFDRFVTDGRVIYLRKLGNTILRAMIVEGTFLSYDNSQVKSQIFKA